MAAVGAAPIVLLLALAVGASIPFRIGGYPAAAAVIDRTPLRDLAICRCEADRELAIERDDGLALSARLYTPRSPSAQAILLVHGNNPTGGRAPLFRVLAEQLRQSGHLVLVLDLAGYGMSADPLTLGSPRALNKQLDLDAAISFMTSRIDPRPAGLHLVGHSRGAAPVMKAATRHGNVRSVVAIGPSRRTWERLEEPGDLAMFWRREVERSRVLYGRDMPAWYDAAAFKELRSGEVMEALRPVYTAPGHPPVLFVDADREDPRDLQFLEAYVADVPPPKRFVRVESADHYKNTAGAFGLQIYDRRAVRVVIDAIDDWVRVNAGQAGR